MAGGLKGLAEALADVAACVRGLKSEVAECRSLIRFKVSHMWEDIYTSVKGQGVSELASLCTST